ncbi:hypothetical protein [Nitratifractor sp.]
MNQNNREEAIDLEALKKDPQFQENLKRLEGEMKAERSIAKGYQLLDAKLLTEADQEEINEIFTFIVNEAFDRLAELLSRGEKFDMADPEQWATARAVYEHGIQRYSENDLKGAREIFLILYYLITEKELRDAMMIHSAAVAAGHDFDSFIENLADVRSINPNDATAFFITSFVQPPDILLQMFAKEVAEGEALLAKMEENSKASNEE